MAVSRSSPYLNCNFLVEIEDMVAHFSEVLLPDGIIDVVEYRNGGDPESQTTKLPGRARYTNCVLRRGIIGSLDLFNWWKQVQQDGPKAGRMVRIHLLDENHQVALTWSLLRAWPTKYTGPVLNAQSNEVALETLELACDSVSLD